MSPKRPPSKLATLRPREWDPNDTQALRLKIDLAQETEWRRDVADQIDKIAETLGTVRDTARTAAADHAHKASKEELAALRGRLGVLSTNVRWLRYLTIGVLVVGVLEKLAERKGIL